MADAVPTHGARDPRDPTLAIVNPAAGRGAAARAWRAALPVLQRSGLPVRYEETSAPGHAIELARRAAEDGARTVLAVGGDGTVHEVANGILLSGMAGGQTAAMAVIPAGSGNDFVKQLGIPSDPAAAARLVSTGTRRRVDVGRVGDGFFVNGVGIGFDAMVAREARRIRWLRGTPLYALALLRILRAFRPPHLRVEIDGTEVRDGRMTLVTVANGPCCGGGFWLCPTATLDDGRFDVLLAERTSRRGILGMLAAAMKGSHLGRPGIELRHASRVRVTGPEDLAIHADGEILSPGRSVEMEMLAGALTVIAPVAAD